VSEPATRREIRLAAEHEERISYERRMFAEWLEALSPMATTPDKPYLSTPPWIVVVFEEAYGIEADGRQRKNYYVSENVGIACGRFIATIHGTGLAMLSGRGGFSRRHCAAPRTSGRSSSSPCTPAVPPPIRSSNGRLRAT